MLAKASPRLNSFLDLWSNRRRPSFQLKEIQARPNFIAELGADGPELLRLWAKRVKIVTQDGGPGHPGSRYEHSPQEYALDWYRHGVSSPPFSRRWS